MKEFIESKASKYEESIRVNLVATKEDALRSSSFVEGEEYSSMPLPKDNIEAFDRLKYMTAQRLSEWCQNNLFKTFPTITEKIIDDQITEIENFIAEAQKRSSQKAFDVLLIKSGNVNDSFHEYLRLTNDYYKVNMCDYHFEKISCQVYGKYVLYYNWLLELKEKYFISKGVKSSKNCKSDTEEIIRKLLDGIDNEIGWRYIFKSEEDYNLFVELLTSLFEYEEYKLPNESIVLRPRCKTRLSPILGQIQSELSNVDIRKNDKAFFKIIRILHSYKDLTDDELYKAVIR